MQELNKLVISNTQPLNGEPWLKPTKEGKYSLYICNNGYHLVDNTDEFNITVDTLDDLETIPNSYVGKVIRTTLLNPLRYADVGNALYICKQVSSSDETNEIYTYYRRILPTTWHIPYNLQMKDNEELHYINGAIDKISLEFPSLSINLDDINSFCGSNFRTFSGRTWIGNSLIHCSATYPFSSSKFIITKTDCMTLGNLHYAGDMVQEQNIESEFIFNDTSASPENRIEHIYGYLNSNINISSSLSRPWKNEFALANNKITVSTYGYGEQGNFVNINIGSNVVLQNFIITPAQHVDGLNIADSSKITFGAINANISLKDIALKGYLNIELATITKLANCTIENTAPTVLKITSALISEFQTLGTLLSIKQIEVNSVPKIIIKYINKYTLTETTIIR